VPNRPTRPGKHAARHKAPSAFSRTTHRFGPAFTSLALRRTGGTVVALGAVVLAGAAGNAGSGMVTGASARPDAAMDLPSPATANGTERALDRADTADAVSRSGARTELDVAPPQLRNHQEAPTASRTGSRVARAESIVPEDPREIAQQMMAEEYGWGAGEFSCLDQLWISESNWEVDATNPTSGAYGIPQSLPAEKMASAGSDWRTNPATQIEWGLNYIDLSYGTPCSAWEFKQANDWY
jgi:hypothetical protein